MGIANPGLCPVPCLLVAILNSVNASGVKGNEWQEGQ